MIENKVLIEASYGKHSGGSLASLSTFKLTVANLNSESGNNIPDEDDIAHAILKILTLKNKLYLAKKQPVLLLEEFGTIRDKSMQVIVQTFKEKGFVLVGVTDRTDEPIYFTECSGTVFVANGYNQGWLDYPVNEVHVVDSMIEELNLQNKLYRSCALSKAQLFISHECMNGFVQNEYVFVETLNPDGIPKPILLYSNRKDEKENAIQTDEK